MKTNSLFLLIVLLFACATVQGCFAVQKELPPTEYKDAPVFRDNITKAFTFAPKDATGAPNMAVAPNAKGTLTIYIDNVTKKATFDAFDSKGKPNQEMKDVESSGLPEAAQSIGASLPQPIGVWAGGLLALGVSAFSTYKAIRNSKNKKLLTELVQSIEKNPDAKEAMIEGEDHSDALKKEVKEVTSAMKVVTVTPTTPTVATVS